MSFEKVKDFPSITNGIQYRLTENALKPLIWFHNKTLALIKELKFFQYNLKFGQRDDDVYICTFMKSGTTLLQMMLYQMTTKGEVDFDHIYDVSPWIRNDAVKNKPPLNFPSPRLIKSHDSYDSFEKDTKGRFIHVIRDGKDVAVSLYHQNKNYNNPDLTFEKNFKSFFVRNGRMNWFVYNRRWLLNRNKFNILYLRYEDLIDQKERAIHTIAAFLKIELTPEIVKRTLERSSFEFMKQHEDKFGEQPIERVYNQFIRKGKKGEGDDYLSEEQKKFFQKRFDRYISGILK